MCELAVEFLGDSKYKQHLKYAIIVWVRLGCVLVILHVITMAFGMAGLPSLYVLVQIAGLGCVLIFMSEVEPQHVRKMVEDKLVPPVKRLHTSIMEWQCLLVTDPEILVQKQWSGECLTTIRRLILDNELMLKSLKRVGEDIFYYNQFVELGRSFGYAMQLGGSCVAVMEIIHLFKYGIDKLTVDMLVAISVMTLGIIFIKVFNVEMYFETKKIVDNRVVPLMTKLQESVDELQTHWKGVAGVCATPCGSSANQITQLKYFNSLDTSQITIISVKLLPIIFRLIWRFAQDMMYPTAEHIIDHLLPWLQQHIKELKNVEQQLSNITVKISDVTTNNNSVTII